MSQFDGFQLSPLDTKALDNLGDRVVLKALARQSALDRLPRYVSEYLVAKKVRHDTWKADLADLQERIKLLLPTFEERELLKERLLRNGELTIIDQVEVKVDLAKGQRWAAIPALNESKARIEPALLEQHVGLLLGGLWGTVVVAYRPEADGKAPNEITKFTPFQIGPPNLGAHREARKLFSTDEWIDLVLTSSGYNPASFANRRTKLLILSRLVPLVEKNVNLLELGPRQTGKTFLLRNLSPRVFTLSEGKATPANLFVNLATKAVGILGTRKVVVFDEIAHATFPDEDSTVTMLKDFMESGTFTRGSMSFASDAGVVMSGNIDVTDGMPHSRYRHLLEPLPDILEDTAFQDRIHAYIPGWEIPKIGPDSMATGVGFVTDHFGEVLVKLREDSFIDRVRALQFQQGLTKRDMTAIERVGSGLLKIIHPHGEASQEELEEVVDLASEMRQRIHNQLVKLAPGEFKPKVIGRVGLEKHAAADLAR
jgi:ATP-dependent Lon protease